MSILVCVLVYLSPLIGDLWPVVAVNVAVMPSTPSHAQSSAASANVASPSPALDALPAQHDEDDDTYGSMSAHAPHETTATSVEGGHHCMHPITRADVL